MTTGRTKKRPKLPTEVIGEILTRLPTITTIRFRSVSKHLSNFLTLDPFFLQKHVSQTNQKERNSTSFIFQPRSFNEFYYLANGALKPIKLETITEPGELKFVGSSNGLICFYSYPNHSFAISLWNPATKEYKKLPPPPPDIRFGHLGFGFHPIINDYKVVRLVNLSNHPVPDYLNPNLEVNVYSLSTNSWKIVGTFPYEVAQTCTPSTRAAFLNGNVHWLGSSDFDKYDSILSFDLAEELCRVVSMPTEVKESKNTTKYLRVFRGCLSVFVKFFSKPSNTHIDVWLMKEYGVEASWVKLFTLEHNLFIYPIDFLLTGEILLEVLCYRLASYNPTTKRLKYFETPIFEKLPRIDVVPYVENLVQLSPLP